MAIAFSNAGKSNSKDAITSVGQEQQTRNAFATQLEYTNNAKMTRPPGLNGMDAISKGIQITDPKTGRKS